MAIREMSNEECLVVLAGTRLVRLGCAHENQPYVIPVSLTYHKSEDGDSSLYGITTVGQKVEWMRTNPLVCVEIDDVTSYDQWVSVIAYGRYEELLAKAESNGVSYRTSEIPFEVGETPLACPPDGNQRNEEERAWQILKTHPMWQEPCITAWAARVHRDSAEPFIAVYYRIWIDRLTGHKASRNAIDVVSNDVPASHVGRWDWLFRLLSRVSGRCPENDQRGTKDTKASA